MGCRPYDHTGDHHRRTALWFRQDQRNNRLAQGLCPARHQGARHQDGPDYIDPGFHAFATGTSGLNLDSWAMQPELLRHLLLQQADGADLVLIESAMGLFDGIPVAENRTGSAADLARLFGIPVLLVLDVSGQSQTAAAVAYGFAHYDPVVTMAAVVLNRAGSERHRTLCTEAIEKSVCLSQDASCVIRHSSCRNGIWAWCRPANIRKSTRI